MYFCKLWKQKMCYDPPQMELLDLSEAIERVSEAHDDWNTEPEALFYCLRACSMIAVIIPVFEAEKTEAGIVVSAFGKIAIHEISIHNNSTTIGSQALDDKSASHPEHFFVGPADNPESWLGMIRHVFRVERAIMQTFPDWAGRTKGEWNEYLRIRRERLGF
jgi:hypothetical protein